MNAQRKFLLSTIVFILLLGACQRGIDSRPALTGETYPIDPAFRQFYNQLGGETIVGPGISPVFEDQGVLYQYIVAGLLKYDPSQNSGSRFNLAPLGQDMGIYELPEEKPDNGSLRLVAGYAIPGQILPLYDQLGGSTVVGQPLTELHKNVTENRFEQYFENLGFYWNEDDPQEIVRLLAYGVWKCDRFCRHSPPSNDIVTLPSQKASAFVKTTGRLGLNFTGYMLTAPRLTPDGRLEQVYENLIMAVTSTMPDEVFLLPLPGLVGVQTEEPAPPSPVPGMIYYPVEEGLGYNVPVEFYDYINAHGSFEFVGKPITHVSWQSEQFAEQCFENLCLRGIREDGNSALEVHPVALGVKYREIPVDTDPSKFGVEPSADISIQIWEDYPLISPNQEQEIGVIVQSNGVSMVGVEPELTITRPDGIVTYVLPPTNLDGETSIRLQPVEASNGTLIPYRVCILVSDGQKFCVVESYLIWHMQYIEVTPSLPIGQVSFLPFVVRNLPLYVPALVEGYKTYIPLLINQSISN